MHKKAPEKSKVKAIYPLSTIQTAMLFHHLKEKDDLGFLNVQCTIEGAINIELLKKSWNHIIQRHPILRTSVHWEKVKNPIQVIVSNSKMDWTILDWSNSAITMHQQMLTDLKLASKANGIDFKKGPLSQISLIKTNPKSYYLIWCCHHLLIDGWSSSIILKDVFNCYNAFCQSTDPVFERTVPSYKTYLNWQKSKNKADAKLFWTSTFKNASKTTLFNRNNKESGTFMKTSLQLDASYNTALKKIARHNHVTINTLCQGIWSLLLSRYFDTKEVTFGNTVSGRSVNFPNIEVMTGMFINMLPVKVNTNPNMDFKDWLKTIQIQQQKSRTFEDTTSEEIIEWSDNASTPLFDNLFVFENFPWEDIKSGDIIVKDFKSGITSNYPLTFVAKIDNGLDFDIISDTSIINKEVSSWFLNNLKVIIEYLIASNEISIKDILKNIKMVPNLMETESHISEKQSLDSKYVAPSNPIELELAKIWESVFNKNSIGVHDNFFDLGGKSLMAVKLFSIINQRLNCTLPAVTLLENPTIWQIATIIQADKPVKSWNNLVPLRSTGQKDPIFCLHAGGGHVFFYNPLAQYLDKNRPVYAIQPSGLYGKLPRHESIEAMAIDYVNEIRTAYPNGPYNLLVYCHSTAVGFEMANLFKTMGEKSNLIVMDTMAEQEYVSKNRLKMRTLGFLKRLTMNPFTVICTMISFRFKKYIKPFFLNIYGSEEAKNTSNTMVHLINIYNKYHWKHFDLPIILVLTNKVNILFNKEILSSWYKIADDVTTLEVKGDHRTLFEDPDVKHVAKVLDDYLR